ncbi:hypothetical protein GJ496_004212 [Pomphorhynchus laevis]|nr:hypothetical protein GJ496_004212 [Pomphorhynchus laevis]
MLHKLRNARQKCNQSIDKYILELESLSGVISQPIRERFLENSAVKKIQVYQLARTLEMTYSHAELFHNGSEQLNDSETRDRNTFNADLWRQGPPTQTLPVCKSKSNESHTIRAPIGSTFDSNTILLSAPIIDILAYNTCLRALKRVSNATSV